MPDPDDFRPTPRIRAAALCLLRPGRFLEAAVEHAAWINLQVPDQRQRFIAGEYEPIDDDLMCLERRRRDQLRRQFWVSLVHTFVVAAIALVVATLAGASLSMASWSVAGGTCLVTWAAIFELGGPGLASWSGRTLSEQIHPVIFEGLFLTGSLLLMLAALAGSGS